MVPTLLLSFMILKQAQATDLSMSITPQSCMASSGWCETEVIISWQQLKETPICIKIEHQQQAYCFDKSLTASTSIAIKTEKPITIVLVHAVSQKVLVTQVLNVFVREHKSRKRQRHAWSIIL